MEREEQGVKSGNNHASMKYFLFLKASFLARNSTKYLFLFCLLFMSLVFNHSLYIIAMDGGKQSAFCLLFGDDGDAGGSILDVFMYLMDNDRSFPTNFPRPESVLSSN